MTRYVVEQKQPTGRVVRREVEADGYIWDPAGVVSFARQTDDKRHTTFATLYECLLVAEADTIDPIPGEEPTG